MEKRKITFGNYDTAANGWTLTGWKLGSAEQKTKYIEKPNGDGSWDLSTALTDGIPKYKDRALTVTLEISEGSRMNREAIIRQMINQLDGMKENIILPDDEFHYVTGRIHVVREYNDLAHGAVTVTAICEPWKYASTETVINLSLAEDKETIRLFNGGRRAVIPTIEVTGSALFEFGTASFALSNDTRQWPELMLTPGSAELTVSGSGSAVISYREAVLE